MKNITRHRDIKLVTTGKRKNYLVSEPNYHTTKFFTENLLAIEINKTEIVMSKPLCLGLSILKLTKKLMYEFCYDLVKPKYCEKVKLFYMDTDSVVLFIKADYIYKDIAGDLETRFDTSNYELDRKFLMKDELGRKILTKFVGLKVTIYNYLKDGKVKRKKQMYHKTKNLNVKILKTV